MQDTNVSGTQALYFADGPLTNMVAVAVERDTTAPGLLMIHDHEQKKRHVYMLQLVKGVYCYTVLASVPDDVHIAFEVQQQNESWTLNAITRDDA